MKKLILLFCVLFHVNLYSQWSTNPNVNNPVCRSVNDPTVSNLFITLLSKWHRSTFIYNLLILKESS